MGRFDKRKDYWEHVEDLMADTAVQSMRLLPQHAKGVSCYHHSVLVSYSSFCICSVLGLDARAAARGGLLHDLYLYNWLVPSSHPGVNHAFGHPAEALKNARSRFPVSPREADIIATHMFPLTVTKIYGCLESLVVSTMDKVCAMGELLHLVPALPEQTPTRTPQTIGPRLRAYDRRLLLRL